MKYMSQDCKLGLRCALRHDRRLWTIPRALNEARGLGLIGQTSGGYDFVLTGIGVEAAKKESKGWM